MSWYYYNVYLPNMMAQMEAEWKQKDEDYERRLAERNDEEYLPPDVRRRKAKKRRRQEKIEKFEEEYERYLEWRENPEEFEEQGITVRTIDGEEITDKEKLHADWVPYIGSQGGRGWRNTWTDEVRYQLERPVPPREPPDPEMYWRD